MMTPQQKKDVAARLKRVRGQVEGVARMVDDDRYCVDVLLQISAARAALAKVSKALLESHIQTCVVGAFETQNRQDRQAKISELLHVFDKNCNC